jgi:hypothetical protein
MKRSSDRPIVHDQCRESDPVTTERRKGLSSTAGVPRDQGRQAQLDTALVSEGPSYNASCLPAGQQYWRPYNYAEDNPLNYHRRIMDEFGNTVEGGSINWHRPWKGTVIYV